MEKLSTYLSIYFMGKQARQPGKNRLAANLDAFVIFLTAHLSLSLLSGVLQVTPHWLTKFLFHIGGRFYERE